MTAVKKGSSLICYAGRSSESKIFDKPFCICRFLIIRQYKMASSHTHASCHHNWMYVLTKISWSGFISQTTEQKNLDSKVEARRIWLSKWMKFSHQNFLIRFYLAESSIALTETQRCKHKEPDRLNGCRFSHQSFLVRFYHTESSMARTWIQR